MMWSFIMVIGRGLKFFVKLTKFSVKLTKFSVKLKIKVICKTFAAPRECKSFADHFDFHFDGKLRKICICYRNCFSISYLVNYIAIDISKIIKVYIRLLVFLLKLRFPILKY